MKLSWKTFEITPQLPFTIARGTTTSYTRMLVRLEDEAARLEGFGEAAPNLFYHEDAVSVHAALAELAERRVLEAAVDGLEDIAALEDHMRAIVPTAASARAAVSMAAHDLLGRKLGKPLFELLGLDPNLAPPSSFTIAIPRNESDLVRRLADAHAYPILKIKLGTDRDEFIVRAVRRIEPRKILRVDANAAWSVDRALAMDAFLADHGVELVEQPLPREDLAGLRAIVDRVKLPIIADESCVDSRDVAGLAGAVHGINIKLAKCGGLAEARRMVSLARQHRMRVMLGCMVESSLGITAAAHLAPLVDYADLDGAALLADDPYRGASIENGMIRVPVGAGLGVTLRKT